jgi:hypothetical protein
MALDTPRSDHKVLHKAERTRKLTGILVSLANRGRIELRLQRKESRQ